ncbi:MAG: hypothetical protein KA099_01925 [Alphaproteobacteria bacterium]|nr:hypothetical protein [Alphaproteobacteria bacterium]MBP7762038.1 hypothetical protein [Alphaproteobacteria bacterium]MBP7904061.1 hypothetical protein [Alphaproteobacteria bacterium]
MTDSPDEQLYKKTFTPESWVPLKQADHAKTLYAKLYDSLTELARAGHKDDYRYYYYKAIEIFCTDEELRDVWETKTKRDYEGQAIMSIFNQIFSLCPSRPKITETKRNNRLKEIDKYLKKIERLAVSDGSVGKVVSMSLAITHSNILEEMSDLNPEQIKKSSQRTFPPLAVEPSLFFKNLREEIKNCHMNTHSSSTHNIGGERTSERVYFIHEFTELVRFIHEYKRKNHAMTARILNKIRPDLGPFSDDNIRQVTTKKRSKAKSLIKKSG